MAELEEEASRQLSDGILVKPNVAAEVITDGTFFILGEARAPGQYPYVPNMTVLTAVSMAGGFTFRAEKDAVSITRLVDGQMSAFRADPLDFVAPRSEEHTSELQSLMRISYAVFCLKKKIHHLHNPSTNHSL